MTPGRAEVGCLVLLGLSLFWFQGGAVLENLKQTLIPQRFSADVQQQIFPFFRYLDGNAFANDYVADYYLANYPLGYKALYAIPAWFGVDPTRVSQALPHGLWFATVAALGAVAYRLGGNLCAFCAAALALGSNVFLDRIQGGLPRAFGFPILALALVGLAYARVAWCVASVFLGALFYPVAGIISGCSLAALLLLPERTGWSVPGWRWRWRLLAMGGTALVSVALLVPGLLASGRFGDVVRPRDLPMYPEAGPSGRYTAESRAPFPGFLASVGPAMDETLVVKQEPWFPDGRHWLLGNAKQPRQSENYRRVTWALLVLVVVSVFGLLVREPAARRITLLGAAAAFGYTLAQMVLPFAYLPERYVAFAVPLLGTIAVATCPSGLFVAISSERGRCSFKQAAAGVVAAALLYLFAGRITADAGLTVDAQKAMPLLDYISRLPKDSLVAGWPDRLMNAVPYVGRRPALLTEECHQAFHKGYIEEMRRRMRGLIEAYFATSAEPILRLREEFGVTHLLINRSYFGNPPPKYFAPFDRWLEERREAASGRPFELSRQVNAARVFALHDYVLLDLSRIQPSSTNRAAEQ